jgi:hypothetical protein
VWESRRRQPSSAACFHQAGGNHHPD